MNELLEKMKGLDKRVLIGGGVAIVVVIVALVVLLAGDNDKPAGGDTQLSSSGAEVSSQIDTEDASSTEDLNNTETLNTETATEDATEVETEVTEVEGSEIDSTEKDNSQKDDPKKDNSEKDDSGKDTTDKDNSDKDDEVDTDRVGSGTKADPYLETPNLDTMSLTIKVPAGKVIYYGIYRVGGKWLEIEDNDAYAIDENSVKHSASGGVLGFVLEDKMPNEYVVLAFGNNSNLAKEFKITFGDIRGSLANPQKIVKVGSFEKTLAEGSEKGYFYRYVAQKSGTLRFYFKEYDKDSAMSITNNAGGATVQKNFDTKIIDNKDEQPEDYAVDKKGRRYIDIKVNKGDEIIINVAACTKRAKYPEVTFTWAMEWK